MDGTNAAMSLAAGVMVDRLGARVCTFIFLSLCLLGQIVYGLAPVLPLSSNSQYGLQAWDDASGAVGRANETGSPSWKNRRKGFC